MSSDPLSDPISDRRLSHSPRLLISQINCWDGPNTFCKRRRFGTKSIQLILTVDLWDQWPRGVVRQGISWREILVNMLTAHEALGYAPIQSRRRGNSLSVEQSQPALNGPINCSQNPKHYNHNTPPFPLQIFFPLPTPPIPTIQYQLHLFSLLSFPLLSSLLSLYTLSLSPRCRYVSCCIRFLTQSAILLLQLKEGAAVLWLMGWARQSAKAHRTRFFKWY